MKLEVAQGRANGARARLDALLATRPDHLFGHGLLGQVLALSGHWQEADAQFREASRLNPKWITPWIDWGGLWLAQKQPGLAIEVIQNGLKANPTSEELHMLLASAYSTQGQIEHAITVYDEALRLNPRNVLAANNLAVLLVDHKGDAQKLTKGVHTQPRLREGCAASHVSRHAGVGALQTGATGRRAASHERCGSQIADCSHLELSSGDSLVSIWKDR